MFEARRAIEQYSTNGIELTFEGAKALGTRAYGEKVGEQMAYDVIARKQKEQS